MFSQLANYPLGLLEHTYPFEHSDKNCVFIGSDLIFDSLLERPSCSQVNYGATLKCYPLRQCA